MRIPDSELIINGDGTAFHLHIRPEQLSDNVLLVGDPERVAMIKSMFDAVECETSSREFVSATGTYRGTRFTALSTGIGTDNIDIVITELDALANIDFETREERKEHRSLNILRMGTCGAIQPDIELGSLIFSSVSVGCDGLLNWYEGREKISDAAMEQAFAEQVRWNGYLPKPYFAHASEKMEKQFEDYTLKGITIAASGFYGPQGRSVRLKPALPHMLEDFENFRFGNMRILNFEMESSAVAGMAGLLGHNGATICCAIANRYVQQANTDYKALVNNMLKLGLDKLSE